MRTPIILVLMIGFILMTGCSRKLQQEDLSHPTKERLPRMVFIENQVNPLNTLGDLPDEQRVQVEIRKKDGEVKAGNLISISEEALTIDQGAFAASVGDSLVNKKQQLVVQKKEILVLKVW